MHNCKVDFCLVEKPGEFFVWFFFAKTKSIVLLKLYIFFFNMFRVKPASYGSKRVGPEDILI